MIDQRQSQGFRIHAFDAVTSTSDEAERLALGGAADRTIIWARSQTKGRGRLGRTWVSPAGNLYTTSILDPGLPLQRLQELSFVASLAVYETVGALGVSGSLVLKWPNDVLLDGSKISGILTETVPRGDGYVALLGVGINLAFAPPASLTRYPATCLEDYLAAPLSVETLLDRYLAALGARYDLWKREGFAPIRDAWIAGARWIGLQVEVDIGAERLSGRYEGIEADGTMIIVDETGTPRKIAAGDVRLLGEE